MNFTVEGARSWLPNRSRNENNVTARQQQESSFQGEKHHPLNVSMPSSISVNKDHLRSQEEIRIASLRQKNSSFQGGNQTRFFESGDPMIIDSKPKKFVQRTKSISPECYKGISTRHKGQKRPSRSRPVVKLTMCLIETFTEINKTSKFDEYSIKSLTPPQKCEFPRIYNQGWDDENNDYIINIGEIIDNRYCIKDIIGKGSFGRVIRATDTITREEVAIKISKSNERLQQQAQIEIGLLASLCEKAERHNIVELLSHFKYRNHQFLVFELLSLNLYEVLRSTNFQGVSIRSNLEFTKQLLTALSLLRQPHIDIIHCDVKPENILLSCPLRNEIKLIDFGSSCKSKNNTWDSYVQSRYYRAPEVMLGLPYTCAIDMWSLGCILIEMHTGRPVFTGSDSLDQISSIVEILGPLPTNMMERSPDTHRLQLFERGRYPHHNQWVLRRCAPGGDPSSEQKKLVSPSLDPMISLLGIIGSQISRKKNMYPIDEPGQSSCCYDMFIDLVYCMLCYDPAKRITPDDALKHPYFLYNS